MRYRVTVTRLQVADRWVRATDEEDAAQKVRAEFDRPYGYLGSWKTVSSGVEVVEEEPVGGLSPGALSKDGPLILPIKEAAQLLGVSRNHMYELVNNGDIEHLPLASRRYVSREALLRFIEQNTHRGYHR
ncbi:MAG: helix-turn-helix domain-containing protein [Micropruina sp.]